MTLGSLDSTWAVMTVGAAGDSSGYMSAVLSMMGQSVGAIYTQGRTVQFAGTDYLVAYHNSIKFDLTKLMNPGSSEPQKTTVDTVLNLALINLRVQGSLSDIRPFDLQKEIAEAAKPSNSIMAQAQGKVEQTDSLSNLKQLGLALDMYAQDHNETLPNTADQAKIRQILAPYVGDSNNFKQPGTDRYYIYNSFISFHRAKDFKYPSMIIAFYEAAPDTDGKRGVVFLDGHAKRLTQAEWEKYKKASKIP
jgi:hypothetical protein